MRILAVIPAKMDSKRLPGKNMKRINGKTLIEHAINYAKAARSNNVHVEIMVSTESKQVIDLVNGLNEAGLHAHVRKESLLGEAEVADVYGDIAKMISSPTSYDYLVGLQPDHPNREHTLMECITYMRTNKYDDLFTVEPSYRRSGSVRILKWADVVSGKFSKRVGCIRDSAVDIHTQQDLNKAITEMNHG